MAVVVSQQEAQTVSVEDIWQLVVLVQQAIFRRCDDDARDSPELAGFLLSHPYFAGIVRSQGLTTETVSLNRRTSDATVDDLLQRLLMAIEDGDELSTGILRRYRVPVQSLKEAIHRYLQAGLRLQLKHQTVEHLVQRSMYHFAYGLSHEINNPLANIAARAAQMAASTSSQRDKKSLRTIVDQAMKAHEMLAEMMLAVKPPPLTYAAGDLRPLVQELSREWSVRAADRSIVWSDAIGDDFLWTAFDRVALSEAISAGIRNAMEACRSGDRVLLVAERSESSTGELEIRLAIIDNGPGLSQESLEQAWNLYFSGREAGRGLGIGLAKVRRVIDAHQGRVWLASKSGQGCAMEIRLPWKRIPSVA